MAKTTTIAGNTFLLTGKLTEFTRDEAEAIIMQARVKAGWISEADLAQPATEEPAEEAAPAE